MPTLSELQQSPDPSDFDNASDPGVIPDHSPLASIQRQLSTITDASDAEAQLDLERTQSKEDFETLVRERLTAILEDSPVYKQIQKVFDDSILPYLIATHWQLWNVSEEHAQIEPNPDRTKLLGIPVDKKDKQVIYKDPVEIPNPIEVIYPGSARDLVDSLDLNKSYYMPNSPDLVIVHDPHQPLLEDTDALFLHTVDERGVTLVEAVELAKPDVIENFIQSRYLDKEFMRTSWRADCAMSLTTGEAQSPQSSIRIYVGREPYPNRVYINVDIKEESGRIVELFRDGDILEELKQFLLKRLAHHGIRKFKTDWIPKRKRVDHFT